MSVRLAVVGATGAVGSLVLKLLAERNFPFSHLKLLASKNSVGKTIHFRGKDYPVELLEPGAFRDVDIAIASTPDEVAAEFVPWAVEQGTVVVDESGYHRMRPDVPLVIPEVNPEAIAAHRGLIASPNCSTTQLVVALKPLHDAARVKRVVVATYQATSGAGVAGQADLVEGTRAALDQTAYRNQTFKHPIAFNLIPQIGSPKTEGYTSEEMKMVQETHKILGDDSIRISATCVRVPVENCHSEAIWVETERPLSVEQARKLWEAAPGISVVDDLGAGVYPMPHQCSDRDDVFIGRIRRDLSCDNGLTFWCVSDNLRKGAATNAFQIAELLARQFATSGVS
jgi:aspartate-semialdehyde dehydrogenase